MNTLKYIFIALACLASMHASTQTGKKYFTGDNTNEISFNQISKSAQRATRDLENLPAAYSLKQYAPVPGSQGKFGTCVAWSASYAARTISYCIQHQVTDPAKIKLAAFSPNYLYYYVKSQGDINCTMGANIEPAMKALTDTGDVLLSENIPECISNIDHTTRVKAKDYTIKAYSSLTNTFGRINKNEVIAIKKGIAEKKPIIFSIRCYSSLFGVGKDGAWKKGDNDSIAGNHALCIVGYDDNKYGGAFEVINSWGTEWGNDGFFWMTYDQLMQHGSYALEMMDREAYDSNARRGLGPPELKGSLDFVMSNEFGNDAGPMPVVLTKIARNGAGPGVGDKPVFANYTIAKNYNGGVFFKIKCTTNAPAFVYLFSIDENKVVSTLFPYADNVSPVINSNDETIYLPSEEKHYTLSAAGSRDNICVLYSKTAIDFNDLKSRITKAPSTFYETILSLFKNRLVPAENINFKENQISFDSRATEQELICFFIDMDHA